MHFPPNGAHALESAEQSAVQMPLGYPPGVPITTSVVGGRQVRPPVHSASDAHLAPRFPSPTTPPPSGLPLEPPTPPPPPAPVPTIVTPPSGHATPEPPIVGLVAPGHICSDWICPVQKLAQSATGAGAFTVRVLLHPEAESLTVQAQHSPPPPVPVAAGLLLHPNA